MVELVSLDQETVSDPRCLCFNENSEAGFDNVYIHYQTRVCMTDDINDRNCFQDQCQDNDSSIRTIDEEHSFNRFIHKSLTMGKLAKTKIAKKSFFTVHKNFKFFGAKKSEFDEKIISRREFRVCFLKPPLVGQLGVNISFWFIMVNNGK